MHEHILLAYTIEFVGVAGLGRLMSPDHLRDLICFGIGLCIPLDKSYSNSYKHRLYIKSRWKKLSTIRPNKWMDEN